MAVTYLIKFNVVPDQRSRFLALLQDVLDAMRSEPMFHEAVLHCDPASDCRFMLYETWEDHDDVLQVQLQRPYRQAWHEALPALLRCIAASISGFGTTSGITTEPRSAKVRNWCRAGVRGRSRPGYS
ncbi:putative quinol monooxygenase [Bradyrhizobium jicamae]|uniref:putative quinol monooxygenase n=1 Tax=Bradyrhizobium jicamae TaxID=280332 RepID=UPI001BA8442A|nr:putative quinol monooxygenase [Bradyrhizobium jicamae]MBR0937735.1 antibiotic biosynthesis monooxygenase [Bradyrhizobium jicamae]